MRCSKRLLAKRQFPLSTPAPTGFGSCLASQRQLTSLNQWKINQCRKLHFLKTEEFRYETKLVEKKKKRKKKDRTTLPEESTGGVEIYLSAMVNHEIDPSVS